MTFQERILRRLKKTNNFRYLDVLVNSGKKEIKLTSDIVLDSFEEMIYGEGIEIIIDNLIIDGNGYQIDAKGKARIFSIEHKNITFKNLTFVNATPNPTSNSVTSIFNSLKGGAVSAFESKLSFVNCTFKDNADHRVGAISLDFCEASIDGCRFAGNVGSQYAGAILNDELSSLTVTDSEFTNNVSYEGAGDIRSVESSLRVIGCVFSNHQSNKTSIEGSSSGNLILINSKFKQSDIEPRCPTVIRDCSFKDSTVHLTHFATVHCLKNQKADIPFDGDNIAYLNGDMDWVRELTQHEFAREFLKYFPKFRDVEFSEQEKLHDEMSEFLEIWREIWSNESNFVMADVIVNVMTLDPEDIRDNYLNRISRQGATDKDSYAPLHRILDEVLEFVDFPAKTFAELDELIHSGENIALNADVSLKDSEARDYKDGIKIDEDNLVIDGYGHIIDADGKTSIFMIDAENVTIKNIVFKNAFSHMGGAVSNIGEVTFENCTFTGNIASELGGAIVNDEKMSIYNCLFEGNSSGGVGGAISATFASELEIRNTKFKSNKARLEIDCPGEILPDDAQGFGGAIYNNGKLNISTVEFCKNTCDRKGGAMIVLPDSEIKIKNTLFEDNHAKVDGGVFHTMGDVDISDSSFISNCADNNAGVFDATPSSKLRISNPEFDNNTAKNGNDIVNKGKLELIGTEISGIDIVDESMETDGTQPALPEDSENSGGDENERVEDGSANEESANEFPDDYDDFARKFKDCFEEMIEDKSEDKALLMSLEFALWASRFPEDANMIGAALMMANIYGDDLVRTILDDFDKEEYKKRLKEYDPIDEELSSWFGLVSLIVEIFVNSTDDELDDKTSSK